MKHLHQIYYALLLIAALSINPLMAQNVGIGTTTPAKKLDVSGTGGLKVSSKPASRERPRLAAR